MNNTVNLFSQSFRTTTNKKELSKAETYSLSPSQAGLWGNTTGGCKTGSLGNSNQECRPWLFLATKYDIKCGTTICCLTFALFSKYGNSAWLHYYIWYFGIWKSMFSKGDHK